jgi:DNA-binding transcriptional ArsR family regulator
VSPAGSATIDQRLAKALTHPLRVEILALLNERVASPNEISEELGERLGTVSYHVRTLLELDCVELVRTAQRRGAVEHYYRAIARPFFSDRDWKRLPASARQSVSDIALRAIWKDVSGALEAGTFDGRDDRHLSRTPLVVDEEGWRDLSALLTETLDRAMQIEADSASRLAESKEEGVTTKCVLMQFESPPPSKRQRAAKSPARRRRK